MNAHYECFWDPTPLEEASGDCVEKESKREIGKRRTTIITNGNNNNIKHKERERGVEEREKVEQMRAKRRKNGRVKQTITIQTNARHELGGGVV